MLQLINLIIRGFNMFAQHQFQTQQDQMEDQPKVQHLEVDLILQQDKTFSLEPSSQPQASMQYSNSHSDDLKIVIKRPTSGSSPIPATLMLKVPPVAAIPLSQAHMNSSHGVSPHQLFLMQQQRAQQGYMQQQTQQVQQNAMQPQQIQQHVQQSMMQPQLVPPQLSQGMHSGHYQLPQQYSLAALPQPSLPAQARPQRSYPTPGVGLQLPQPRNGKDEKQQTSTHSKKHEREVVSVENHEENPAKRRKTETPAPEIPQLQNTLPEINESDLISKINFFKGKGTLPTRLESVFGQPYKTSKILYKLIINIGNPLNDKAPPYKCYLEIEGLKNFRSFPEDHTSQSYIFGNEGQFNYFCPEFKTINAPQDAPNYYECRMWQLDASSNYKINVKRNVNEISRCWFTSDEQLGEFHTLHKGETKDNYSIPGRLAVRASDHLFTLFGAKHIYFADASEKKLGVRMRLWNQIIDCSWYEGLTEFSKSPTCPKKLGVAKHLKPFLFPDGRELEQDPELHAKALEKIRRLPVNRFYNLLNSEQKNQLIKIYQEAYGCDMKYVAPADNKKSGSKQPQPAAFNPFDQINCTLQELVKKVDAQAKAKNINIDVELCELICHGVDTNNANTYTKKFVLGTAIADFKSWVYTILWSSGYYREITPAPAVSTSRSMEK